MKTFRTVCLPVLLLAFLCFAPGLFAEQALVQEIFNQGMALYGAGDYRGAADYLAQVLEISPHHDQAAFYLVFCFSMSGNPEKALKYAKILAARYPGYQQYALMVSQLEQQLNKKKELVKNTFSPPLTTDSGALSKTSLPRHSPKNPDGKKMSSSSDNKPLDLAIRMIDEEQYASATQALQKIIRAEPRNAAAMHYMAMAFFNKGDKTKAAEFFEKAIALKHCTFETCFLLASCYIILDELGKAEKYLKTALEIQDDGFAKIRLAEIYAKQGRFDEAEPLFGEIIKANPQIADAKAGLAKILLMRGLLDKAAATANDVIAAHPDNALAHFVKSKIMLENKLYSEAVEEARIAWHAASDNIEFRANFALTMIRNMQIPQGIEEARAILVESHNSVEAILALVEGLLVMGAVEDAVAQLDRAEKIKKHPGISYLRATLALNKGDLQAARQHLENYRALAGELPRARIEYARLLESFGANDEALATYHEILKRAGETFFAEEAQRAVERLSLVKTMPAAPFHGRTPIPRL